MKTIDFLWFRTESFSVTLKVKSRFLKLSSRTWILASRWRENGPSEIIKFQPSYVAIQIQEDGCCNFLEDTIYARDLRHVMRWIDSWILEPNPRIQELSKSKRSRFRPKSWCFNCFCCSRNEEPGKEGVVIPGTWISRDLRHVIEWTNPGFWNSILGTWI
jgi:hypothetical protein